MFLCDSIHSSDVEVINSMKGRKYESPKGLNGIRMDKLKREGNIGIKHSWIMPKS